MNILHINSYTQGGAANSCIRLHKGLLNEGINSNILFIHPSYKYIPSAAYYTQLVPAKRTPAPSLKVMVKRKVRHTLKQLNLDITTKRKATPVYTHQQHLLNRPKGYDAFSTAASPFDISSLKIYQEADIINLHWTANFVDYKNFFRNALKPIVWTLHDMYPFTGGCHYSNGCKGYEHTCMHCPQLAGTIDVDYSNMIWRCKQKGLQNRSVSVVTPSAWLSRCSQSSQLFANFKHAVIAYGIDNEIFQPRDKKFARSLLGLPLDKKILLFVAEHIENDRKGYTYLQEALSQLSENTDVVLCIVGMKKSYLPVTHNIYELGSILDERLMSAVYSAADVFITPSVEDNLPNTVLESIMCGTPVIGFPIGGIPEMIQNNDNGYICEAVTSLALKETIQKFLATGALFDRSRIREAAEKKYSLHIQAKNYIDLYTQIVQP